MSLAENLELLSRAEAYCVSVNPNSGLYEVTPKDREANIAAMLFSNGWQYFLTGVYNTGSDWESIDITQLDALRKFCESLGGAE